MVAYEEMLSKVAQQVKIDENTLSARAEQVLASEGAGWSVVGKTEEECKVLALRVSARQLTAEKAKLSRSGATIYEGMFVYTPRYKDWADMAYKKMKNTLTSMDNDGRMALVSQGALYLYENNHDGTWTRHANPSLMAKQTFEEGMVSVDVDSLPNRIYTLDGNTSFSLVWDKANMAFANGNDNFKYGAARPLNEYDRTCLFAGRKEGEDDLSIISVRLQGELAKTEFPTFVTGKIGLKAANKPDTAYGTKVTTFTADESVMEILPPRHFKSMTMVRVVCSLMQVSPHSSLRLRSVLRIIRSWMTRLSGMLSMVQSQKSFTSTLVRTVASSSALPTPTL